MSAVGERFRRGWRWFSNYAGLLTAVLMLLVAVDRTFAGDWTEVMAACCIGIWSALAWDHERRLRRLSSFFVKAFASDGFTTTTGNIRTTWTPTDKVVLDLDEPS